MRPIKVKNTADSKLIDNCDMNHKVSELSKEIFCNDGDIRNFAISYGDMQKAPHPYPYKRG